MLYQKGMSPVLGGYVNYRGTPLLLWLWLWSWPGTHGIFGVGVAVGSGFSLGAGLSLGLGFAHTAYRVVFLLIFMLSPP